MIVHKNFNNTAIHGFDIALLKLKESLNMSMSTPACLPEKDVNLNLIGRTGWLVKGWGGSVNEDDGLSKILLDTTQEVILKRFCRQHWKYDWLIHPDELCAYNKDKCGGDSGGPLTIEEDGKHVLIGVTAHGEDCSEVN